MNALRYSIWTFITAITSLTSAYTYECNNPLLYRAQLSATSSQPGTGPSYAKLYGNKAWTAQSSDFEQHLTIDLGTPMKLTSVETQGRSYRNEYVMEYGISYSYNGQDYSQYKEEDGNIKIFKGNANANQTVLNRFQVPIIAQWVRINPTRWQTKISLRLELYGCEYESHIVGLNGSSLLRLDLIREPIRTDRHSIRLRFKTANPNGVILYSRGSQGDFIALQLRDNRMLLNINLDVQATMTSLSVGSLLDDNMWHDVLFSRNRKNISFSVDRVLIEGRIKGNFHRLDLNRGFYIGGVPNKQEGLMVYQNFTGCIENLYFNDTNIIQDLKESQEIGENLKYNMSPGTTFSCPEPSIIPVTFLTPESYVKLNGYEGYSTLNVSLAFRTYEEDGMLLFHRFTTPGYVKLYLEKTELVIDIQTGSYPKLTLPNFQKGLNDGKWHQIILTISKNSLILNIDGTASKTEGILDMKTGALYFIGGLEDTRKNGFVGCMRLISVDGNYKLPTDWKPEEYCCKNQIVFDTCRVVDRCNPNPCKHGGVCTQTSREFICHCENTGYTGAVCHTSLNPLSCESYKTMNNLHDKTEIQIDIDGSGPLKPFLVDCQKNSEGNITTILHHTNEAQTDVDGFAEPGGFSQKIIYDAGFDQIKGLIERSTSCIQRISYHCKNSKLFNSPIGVLQDDYFHPNSWWVSRNNEKMNYWGGALPGSYKCECGMSNNCIDPTKWCNCDSELGEVDEGFLRQKEHLPVRELRFGDTGTALDDKKGYYTLGPLICEGDYLLKDVVTFRIVDATINLPTFDLGHNGDIYFEFKTTIETAVIMHSKGPEDFIKISINDGNQIYFQYQAGGGPLTVTVQSSYRLSNNEWHSVSVERNRKQAKIVIDGVLKGEVQEPVGPARALRLTSDLVIGATTERSNGYVGCIRSLLLNGKPQNLRDHAKRGLYGVSEDCMGRCSSNPCLNNGTCHEKYDGYWCDCRWTAFKGPICADEIGVNMRMSSMIKYDFQGNWRSTLNEKIRVGFTTTNPKGFLLGLFSNISGEYMIISISNSGHLRVVFDFGFERREVMYPLKHFALGQYHDVRIRRKNSGSVLVLQVDNYAPMEYPFEIKASADAQFNNIQYMYIGRNESMSEGFTGCISRVEFSEVYPLKLLFQQAGPSNVYSLGTAITEDFCGVEPITHPPDTVEKRPPPEVDKDKVRAAYNETDTALLGSILAIITVALIVMAIIIGRYVSRHKGEYLTQEDKGAEIALDPDSAVVHSTTGHQVQKKKEWFI